ncbi:slit homolog 1 protein-like [Mercenaria mercenaria]|uniref:slit homolog 1 protein-like n=1 Tax=Mercenaria mercenaria TaxID=6596 RepID=UPI00234EF8ED|nr:slit homolog 1 protein-like [Mercenaria mercenaria]XP_053398361.1 slit homolog 1 protein-like [Mercenaria mercenaria]
MIATKFCLWFAFCLVSLKAVQARDNDAPCPAFCECGTVFGLNEVDCSGLTSVPTDIPEDTDILDLSACNLSNIPVEPLAKISSLKIFTFMEVIKDEGNYNLTSLDLPNLFQIDVVNSPLSFVPQLLPSYISQMSLVNITLGTLENGSFHRYPNLDRLTIWSCQLSQIKSGVFDDIPHLSYLELKENNLVDESFAPDLFRKSQALETISLSSNKLTHVISNLPSSLTAVDYSSNAIVTLQSQAFKSTPKLTSLSFQQNKMRTIQDFAFDGLAKVSSVYFNQNEIERLSKYSFVGFTGLTTLYMSQNNISIVEKEAFHPLISLLEFNLDENQISTLEDLTFQSMGKLVTINLSSNKLSNITNNTFTGLNTLSELDISSNLIENIEPGAFEPLKSIRNLRIIGNRLQRLVSEVFRYLPAGTSVYLAANPWQCDCHLRWLREAVDNASYTIEYPEAIGCATPMKLSGKYFKELKPSDFVC